VPPEEVDEEVSFSHTPHPLHQTAHSLQLPQKQGYLQRQPQQLEQQHQQNQRQQQHQQQEQQQRQAQLHLSQLPQQLLQPTYLTSSPGGSLYSNQRLRPDGSTFSGRVSHVDVEEVVEEDSEGFRDRHIHVHIHQVCGVANAGM
jgi:hypothetical protein